MAGFMLFGCLEQPAQGPQNGIMDGSDRDSHGCIPSAGYTWCDAKQKCIRPWEENCTLENGPLVGGDRDAHGCIGSAGYMWCERLQQCIRPWETQCMQVLTEDYPPYSYKDASGTVSGQSTEIVNGILDRMNQQAGIQLMEWSAAYNLALKGPDVVLYSTAYSDARSGSFKWVGPIATVTDEFFSKVGDKTLIITLADAKKAGPICVAKDTERYQLLSSEGFTNMLVANNDLECLVKLDTDKVKLWAGSRRVLDQLAAQEGINASAFAPNGLLQKKDLYIAMSKDVSDDTVAMWQGKLDEMKADGTYQGIVDKYKNGIPAVPMPGSDRDSHGCIPSAGYEWCAETQTCIRPWEQTCTAQAASGAVPASAEQAPAAASTTPAQTTAQAAQLTIYTEDFQPYNYYGDNGKLTGLATDVVKEAMRRMGVNYPIYLKDFNTGFNAAVGGPNNAFYSAGLTSQRKDTLKWAGPIGNWTYGVYAKSGTGLKVYNAETAKVAGKTCVVQGDVRYEYAQENRFPNLIVVTDDSECPKLLMANKAQLWIASAESMASKVKEAGYTADRFVMMYGAGANNLYIAFSRDVSDADVAKWQNAIDGIKADGTYATIATKYGK
ncbi:MAG: substrate-binding periplasmic protein [Candidatus Bilamarchaeaceae archaeon]